MKDIRQLDAQQCRTIISKIALNCRLDLGALQLWIAGGKSVLNVKSPARKKKFPHAADRIVISPCAGPSGKLSLKIGHFSDNGTILPVSPSSKVAVLSI